MRRASRGGAENQDAAPSSTGRATAPAKLVSDRERWLAELVEEKGEEWVEQHKELIEAQLEYIESL